MANPQLRTVRGGEQLVLAFHGLGRVPSRIQPDEGQYWCDTADFEAILDAIGPVSASSGVPIVITFDDGNMSDAEFALPALVKRGLAATFFVCAGRIGTPGYVDECAIRRLLDAGMGIGSHGWSHVDWRRADGEALAIEISGAIARLEEVTDRPIDTVAIPFGSYNRRVLGRLREAHVRTVYTSDRGRALPDRWLIPRESYDVTWAGDTLVELATRSVGPIKRLRTAFVRKVKQLR